MSAANGPMQKNLPNSQATIFKLPAQWGLLISAAIGLGGYLGMVMLHLQQGTLRSWHTPHTIGWYLVAFGGYLLALFWAERQQSASLFIIWSGAIIFRLLLMVTTPTLSDDVYRYIWDGYVTNHGVSPYAHPIDSPALDHLDIPQRAQANNRWMASPYLPTAQMLFAALTYLFPLRPMFFQMAMIMFDLMAAQLLAKLINVAGQPGYRILIYLWNPLVIVEVAHGAHIDALMVYLALLALWLTFAPEQTNFTRWMAPLALAMATLTKILPIFLLPVLFWRWRWRQLLLYGLATAGLLLPFGLSAGWGLTGPLDGIGVFGALRIYADQWNFNSGLFHWLEVNWLPALGVTAATEWAKRMVGAAMLLTLVGVWLAARRRRYIRAELRLVALPFMAYLLLSTTVHPWYLLVLLAFLPLLAPTAEESPWRWLSLAPWLYLSGALALSYVTYLNPLDFREFEWVRNTEWLPTLGLFGIWVVWATTRIRNKRDT